MTAASTQTVAYDAANARVQLNLAGFEALTTGVQIQRQDLTTGRYSLVRGARLIPIGAPASDSVQLYDYEFPAGHEVQYSYYQLPDLTRYTMAASDTYDVTRPWIKNVLRPYLSQTVKVGPFEPYEHQLRGSTSPVVRRSVPIGGGDVRSGRRFQVSLKLEAAERANLDALLRVGGVWFWQIPGTDLSLPDSGYVQPFSAQERLRGRPQDGARWLDLVVDEVAPPNVDLAAAAVTWSSITSVYATWDDLLAAYVTWNDVLATVADPVEVVVV